MKLTTAIKTTCDVLEKKYVPISRKILVPGKQLCKVFVDLGHFEISSFLLMSAKTIISLTWFSLQLRTSMFLYFHNN